MWLYRLSFFCFVPLFSPAPISAGPVVNVGGWERKEQPDRRYEGIGPRMRGHGPRTTAPALPPYQLPMFRHVKAPLVDMELFRPTTEFRPLPSAVQKILLPPPDSWQGYPTGPAGNPKGVEAWCGNGTISVRVNRRVLGFWCKPSMLFLGHCEVYRFNSDYIYFHNYLDECGITPSRVDGQLVYTSVLRYVPEPQGAVIRAVPLSLPIHCFYNRFHYAYKVGYVPHLQKASFFKSITTERVFSLISCNERWERLSSTGGYVLGAPMHFEASAALVSRTERVSITACHVTAFKDPYSMPRMDVIGNFGCMLDSKRAGSRSKFHSYGMGILRFSIDAFLFPETSSKHLFLHCEMTMADYAATPTSKSCNYNSQMRRWEELMGSVSVCSCCDSQCGADWTEPSSLYPTSRSLITSDPWTVLDGVTTGTGRSLKPNTGVAEVPEEALEGQEAEGVSSVAEPMDTKGAGSEAGPKHTEGAESEAGPKHTEGVESEAGPKHTAGAESEGGPVETGKKSENPGRVRGFRGRGKGRGSLKMKGTEVRPSGAEKELLKAEAEPAAWRDDDRGPELDEEEEEEEGGLQEEVGDKDIASFLAVAGTVLESLIM